PDQHDRDRPRRDGRNVRAAPAAAAAGQRRGEQRDRERTDGPHSDGPHRPPPPRAGALTNPVARRGDAARSRNLPADPATRACIARRRRRGGAGAGRAPRASKFAVGPSSNPCRSESTALGPVSGSVLGSSPLDLATATADLTVIIPAFNEEASIADTVRSVLEQTVLPRMVLVVDDGSTDATGEVAT